MCGICGRLDFSLTRRFVPGELRRWSALMRHRGPDDDGVFERPGVGLAMRRLSIIDLEGGAQPIANEDHSVHVVMNGEIYNFRELRDQLREAGHVFRTASDTEVVVHLWEDHGAGAFAKLRGMFAIALWDERSRTLALARDPVGIKPLYYARRADGLDFASEMKLLLDLAETPRDLDPDSLAVYFTIGYIPPPETIYRGIMELPPGHCLVWRPGLTTGPAPFWHLEFTRNGRRSLGEWLEMLDCAVADAVRSHLVADVPVAAFLSGGLDSSAVVAYMAGALDEPPRTFTVRYLGTGSEEADESSLAAQVARRYGTRHTVIDVRPNVAEVLDDIVGAFDQPMADESAVPTYYLTQAVAREVKVALSGLGGDELFGGYERHLGLLMSRAIDPFPRWARRAVGRAAGRLFPWVAGGGLAADRVQRFARSLDREPADRYAGFVTRLWPEEVQGLLSRSVAETVDFRAVQHRLTRHFGRDQATPLLDRALRLDYGQYLPGDILALTDRLSMHHSLEVRVPLVDQRLVELVATMPPDLKVRGLTKKFALRRLMADRLPRQLFRAPKRGFVGPTASWLRQELRPLVTESLSAEALRDVAWLDPDGVQRMVGHHMEGRSDRYGPVLWSLLIFARWRQHHAGLRTTQLR